jgi:hypothetical protein
MDNRKIADDLEEEYLAVANGMKPPEKIALEPMARAVEALRATPTPLADAAAIAEREAFEADYAVVWNAAMIENGGNGGYTAEDVLALREGNEYGADRTYLNARWEGWQARAALATTGAPQHAVGADGLCADKMCSFAWIGPHGHNVPAAATEAPDKPNQT